MSPTPSLEELLFPLPLAAALPLLRGLPQLEGEVEGLSNGEGGRLRLQGEEREDGCENETNRVNSERSDDGK